MYFDTAYVAKYFCNEPDSIAVRALAATQETIFTSNITVVEFAAVLHRHQREGLLTRAEVRTLSGQFEEQIDMGVWTVIPVTTTLLGKTNESILASPSNLFLRAADAIHLETARQAKELEIWTNDRHMLKAASYFGLRGRSIRA